MTRSIGIMANLGKEGLDDLIKKYAAVLPKTILQYWLKNH